MAKTTTGISTGATADVLAAMLTNEGGTPALEARKIHALVDAGLLPNEGTGSHVRIPRSAVRDLGASTRYIADLSELGSPLYRVSVLARRESPVYDLNGNLLRSHAGVDYSLDLPADEAALGYESAWAESPRVLDYLVDSEALLLATCKGFVGPGNARRIVDWIDVDGSPSRNLVTEVDPDVDDLVGAGIWIDVPADGRQNGLLTPRPHWL